MATPSPDLPPKLVTQLAKMRLPLGGTVPFVPVLDRNRAGEPILARRLIDKGVRHGTPGLLDAAGRIWVRDAAHAGLPEHWDVQIDGGADYIRVGYDGEVIP